MPNDKIKQRYNRIATVYDNLEVIMEKLKFEKWREELWNDIGEILPDKNGRMLEVGVGTGKNIKYYPENIHEICAIDFSEKMLIEANKKVSKHKKDVRLIQMDAENLEFESNYFDVIVTSCVFCSVPDPQQGLKELKRVLKPDGRILMLEHMRSNNNSIGKIMDTFNWVSLNIWGANINRRTIENINKAELEIVEEKDLWFDIVKKIILKK
jgi:ubiquinone/menaquinone biosynthesis C-methylase UbiE